MPYLIDGHNLIGQLPGLRLDDPDDEKQLITLLQAFCQRTRKEAHVYFDKAAPGAAGTRKFGRVKAHFVSASSSADDAIRRHLGRLGRKAGNWTVVSSDRAVVNGAHRAGARVLSASDFALELRDDPHAGSDPEQELGPAEVDEWLDLFGGADGGG